MSSRFPAFACPILAGSLAALLAGCSGAPPSSDYFPLQAGHRWIYEQRSTWDNDTREAETLELRTLGSESLPDGHRAWRRRSASGVDYWLRSDASGIYRVASKTDLQAEPEMDESPRYVLRYPLQAGAEWKASTTAYLLRRNAGFPPEIRHSHPPVIMNYRLVALGEAVSTAAGDFKDCVRVQGEAKIKLFADPVDGFRELPLRTTEWYCKGVGLVKLTREEPVGKATFLQGGTLELELTDWE